MDGFRRMGWWRQCASVWDAVVRWLVLFLFLFFCFGGCDSSGCGLIFMGCDGLMLVGGGCYGLILVVFFCFIYLYIYIYIYIYFYKMLF